ncbi:YjgN family protein [Vibrio sp. SCSIO 43136]|uniref:YjgN family protein n=1 Tax=Vibrio sp. SCSIO 43136 TaxID=2819101 RepID=UPI002076017D|nr:YjgN family protein [Vibrio sp. SCSIO 43136]USD65584.1 DUF898 domain-containing protein [Vibrio sp. SCSIO 43136]
MEKVKHQVKFHGRGMEFFGIWIVNILLSIVTLGIYSAWAKVRTNRYFYGNTSIGGDSFDYHAKPMQILKGRLIALVLVLIWSVSNAFFPLFAAVLLIIFYLAVPWLLWSNARFDAAMTSFRNVRFSFDAKLSGAYKAMMGRGIAALVVAIIYMAVVGMLASQSVALVIGLSLLALPLFIGLYAWIMAGMNRYFVNGYRFGDWSFSATIETRFYLVTYLKALAMGVVVLAIIAGGLFATFASGVSLDELLNGNFRAMEAVMPVMFGLIYASFFVVILALSAYVTCCVRNYTFAQLALSQSEEAEAPSFDFESTFGVTSYVWLVVSNFLLQVVTLGLGTAWAKVRAANYVAENTQVRGELELLAALDQDSNVKSAVTDEIAQAFDLSTGIG